MARSLYINLDEDDPSKAFVTSFTDDSPLTEPPKWMRSDSKPQRLLFLRRTEDVNTSRPFYFVDPSGFSSVKFGGGIIGATPDGGTFTLTDTAGAQTTSAIAYNASAATVQTAIRAALTTNFSAATVTGDAGGPYVIDRGATGALADITGSAAALTPDGSTVVIVNTQNGSGTLNERWQVSLAKALPILWTGPWSALPAALVTVTTVQAGSASVNKTFKVVWNADAVGGAVTLSFTGDTATETVGPIPYSANADDVADAFARHTDVGAGGVLVAGGNGNFTITCVGVGIKLSNTPALATANNTLQVPLGLTAVVPVSTAGADAILGTEESADITIEVEVRESSGEPNTCAQAATLLLKDLIVNTPGFATGNEDWATIGDTENIAPHIFADATERDADTPYVAGQLGLKTDDGKLYRALSTTIGDWASAFEIDTLSVDTGPILSGTASTSSGGLRVFTSTAAFYGQISPSTFTADRTFTLPDATGTIALTSHTVAYTAKTATYAITTADCIINCTANTFTVTLPTAVGIAGKVFHIKNTGAGTITVATTSAQTVDGTTPPSVTPGVNLTVASNGANWIIL